SVYDAEGYVEKYPKSKIRSVNSSHCAAILLMFLWIRAINKSFSFFIRKQQRKYAFSRLRGRLDQVLKF
ncbi:MAG: hypothetical protein ACIWVG_25445, partial [Gloeotrichia echinulata HAB0833]